ncbi:hypothetical protein [Tolypothrix sp. VBCCA 56010]
MGHRASSKWASSKWASGMERIVFIHDERTISSLIPNSLMNAQRIGRCR